MNPTAEQLAARLNPQAYTINIPTGGGFFTDTTPERNLYYQSADGKYSNVDVTNLLSAEEKSQAGNYGNQLSQAWAKLGTAGINYNNLQKINTADAFRNAGDIGKLDINSVITKQTPFTAAGTTQQTLNNTPNTAVPQGTAPLTTTDGVPVTALPFNGGAAPQTATVTPATSQTNVVAGGGAATNPYWLQPGESVSAYNARIAAANPNLPAPGTTSSTGVTNNATVNSSVLGGATQTNYTQPVATAPSNLTALQTTPPLTETPQQQKESDLSTQLMSLINQDANRAGDQVKSDAAAGIPAMQNTIRDITAQRQMLAAQAAQINAAQQTGQGVTSAIDARQRTEALRQVSINDNLLAASLNAAQGNLATAQALSNKAISDIYDPIEAHIAAAKENLTIIANDPKTTIQEKNQAQAQLDIKNAQQEAIAQQKQTASDVLSYANSIAANYGANPSSFTATAQYQTASQALTAMQQAKTVADAALVAASTGLGATSAKTGTWSDPYMLGGSYVQKNSSTGEIRTAVNPPNTGNGSGNITGEQLKQAINKQIATPEFQALSDADKAAYIQSQGGTPYDFGY